VGTPLELPPNAGEPPVAEVLPPFEEPSGGAAPAGGSGCGLSPQAEMSTAATHQR
jgi:hypothetical protein